MARTRVKMDRSQVKQLENEIALQVRKDRRVQREPRLVAERVKQKVIDFSPTPDDPAQHPYATGEFIESIKVVKIPWRTAMGQFAKGLSHYSVRSDNDHAWAIEYGTGPDAPGTKSPWGRFTPTPEYAPFAKAALHFRGTPDS